MLRLIAKSTPHRLFFLGFVEQVDPPVAPWYFHKDRVEDIILISTAFISDLCEEIDEVARVIPLGAWPNGNLAKGLTVIASLLSYLVVLFLVCAAILPTNKLVLACTYVSLVLLQLTLKVCQVSPFFHHHDTIRHR